MKIRSKFIFYFIGIALLCIFAIAADSFYNVDKLILQNEENNLTTLADIQKSRINEITDEHLQLLKQITGRAGIIDALSNYVANPNETDRQLLLARVKDANKSVEDFEDVAVVDINGTLITSSNSLLDINLFHPLVELKDDITNDVVKISENDTGDKKIILHGPVRSQDKIIGTVLIVYSLEDLESISADYSGLGKTGETTIAFRNKDGDAEYIKAPRFTDGRNKAIIVPKNDKNVAITQALMKNESLSKNLFDYRGKAVYSVTRYIPDQDWAIVVKKDKSEIYQPIYYHALQLGVISLAIIILIIILSLMAAKKISKPIEDLKNTAQEIEKGDFKHKVEITSQDEIADLGQTFNSMMTAVIASRSEIDRKVNEQTAEISEKAQDMQDQQRAIINILEDVEEEKEITKREKDKIDTILKSIGDAVFVVDRDLKIILVNQITVDLCGFKEEELVGRKYSDVLRFVFETDGKEEKVNDRFVNNAISSGKVQEMSNHTVLVDKAGKRIPVADSAAPLLNQNKEIIGCVVVFRDVTHEYEIDKAKTEFVSLASHQLRTPLSAVNWYAEMLTNGDAGKLTAEQLKYVKQIYDGNQRMVALVNSLLNVSRLELGTFTVEPQATDFCEVVNSVFDDLVPQIKTKKLKIEKKCDKNIPKINADPKLTRIIFQNLLSNSVKYTPDKGTVGLKMAADKNNLNIEIYDTGYGIPEKQKNQIFKKLFRADNVRAKDTEGTGLGLYLVKSIIDQTQGKIWFESVENKGTHFFVTLPLSGMTKKEGTKELEESVE